MTLTTVAMLLLLLLLAVVATLCDAQSSTYVVQVYNSTYVQHPIATGHYT